MVVVVVVVVAVVVVVVFGLRFTSTSIDRKIWELFVGIVVLIVLLWR